MKHLKRFWALTLLIASPALAWAADTGPTLGLQSWTCRQMSFEELVDFATRHGIKQIELCPVHINPKDPLEVNLRKREILESRGLKAYAFGVAPTSTAAAENRRLFEFARAMGMELLIVEPQDAAAWDSLERFAVEFRIKVAVHNHWRGSPYGSPAVVLDLLRQRDSLIGVCLDLGWITAAGFDAAEILHLYGDRVYDIHLKDKRAQRSEVQQVQREDDPNHVLGIAVTEGVTWRDAIPGSGDVNWKGVFAEIRRSRWSGVMALETDSAEFASDPNQFVSNGIEFFQRQFANFD